jgi:hypothetical protein
MIETKIKLSSSCELILNTYDNGVHEATLDYVEHACDHWSSDTDTSINIEKDKATEIVNALKLHFGI